MPDEFGEHLTRDQRPFLCTDSLQILQIPRSMMVLLLFSSATHVQGLGRPFQKLVLCSVTRFCFDFDVCFDHCPVGRSKYGPL